MINISDNYNYWGTMDIHTDWSTTTAIICTAVSVMTFLYKLLKKSNSDNNLNDDDDDMGPNHRKPPNKSMCSESEKVKVNLRLDHLEEENKKYITRNEITYFREEVSTSLESIEKRLTSLLEIIVKFKR